MTFKLAARSNYVDGTRISLDSAVCAFNCGANPESILERNPLLGKPARV